MKLKSKYIWGVGAFVYFLGAGHTVAEVVFDGTIGPNASGTTRSGTFTIAQSDGVVSGNNLFHSFQTFNVNSGESATFTSSGMSNIISRVTGGSVSNINGSISSTASLWLLNPQGVIFGAAGELDVNGSFNVGATDQLLFNNGAVFEADPLRGNVPVLGIASPQSFGFIGDRVANEGSIDIDGGLRSRTTAARPFDLDISLFGREITVNSGLSTGTSTGVRAGDIRLETVGGDITIAGAGSVIANSESSGAGGDVFITTDQALNMGLDSPSGGAAIQAIGRLGGRSGSIHVAANELNMNRSAITNASPNTNGPDKSGSPNGNVIINIGSGGVNLSNVSVIGSDTNNNASAGDVFLTSEGAIALERFSEISSSSNPTIGDDLGGAVGSIFITADGGLVLEDSDISITQQGGNQFTTPGEIVIDMGGSDLSVIGEADNDDVESFILPQGRILASTATAADAGNISVVNARNISFEGGLVSAKTVSSGDAGTIILQATNQISADTYDPFNSGNLRETKITTSTSAQGSAGSITLSAPQIDLNSANISSTSSATNSGSAGSINITGGDVSLIGADLSITTASALVNTAGNVGVTSTSGDILLDDTSIVSSTLGASDAGSVSLTANGSSISIEGGSSVTSVTGSPDLSVASSGSAGDIALVADSISVAGSDLNASLFADDGFTSGRSAGSIVFDANDVSILSDSQLLSESFGAASANPGSILFGSLGDEVGSILIDSSTASVTTFSRVISPGNIQIFAGDVTLDNQSNLLAQISVAEGLSTGPGIDIEASNSVSVLNGSEVSTSLFGGQNAPGDISIISPLIQIRNTEEGLAERARITSLVSSEADRYTGQIDLVGDVSIMDSGLVSTSINGFAINGGININKDQTTGSLTLGRSSESFLKGEINSVNSCCLVGTDTFPVLPIDIGGEFITITGGVINASASNAAEAAPIELNAASSITIEQGSTLSTTAVGQAIANDIDITAPVISITDTTIQADTGSSGAAAAARTTAIDIIGSNSLNIDSSIISASSSGSAIAGTIEIENSGDISIQNTQVTSLAEATSTNNAGIIRINASGEIDLGAGSSIETSTSGAGEAGSIRITGASVSGQATTIRSQALGANSDKAGSINLQGDTTVTLSQGSEVSTLNRSDQIGPSAGITISAEGGALILSDTTVEGSSTGNTDAGNIRLYGTSYFQTGGEVVTSSGKDINGNGTIDTDEVGNGDAGAITIARSSALNSVDEFSLTAGGDIRAVSEGAGEAGRIGLVNSGDITISGSVIDKAEVSVAANSELSGEAGSLNLNGANIDIDHAIISASTASNQTGSVADPASINIVSSGLLSINNSEVTASTTGDVDAGTVLIETRAALLEIGDSEIASRSNAGGVNAGQAGDITLFGRGMAFVRTLFDVQTASGDTDSSLGGSVIDINALGGDVSISGDSSHGMTASTSGAVAAGTINLDSANDLNIDGVSVSSVATETATDNAGGIIFEVSGDVTMSGGTSIETSTSGTGEAGSIRITGASVSGQSTSIRSQALGANSDKAGSITLRGDTTVTLSQGSEVSTLNRSDQVGPSAGITINADGGALSLSDTTVEGSSTGNTDAGDIRLFGTTYSQSGGEVVTSSGKDINANGVIDEGEVGSGDAGAILIAQSSALDSVVQFSLSEGGDIRAASEGAGAAGGISLVNSGDITIAGVVDNLAEVSVAANSELSGAAGTLNLNGTNIDIDHALITARTASDQTGSVPDPASIDIISSGLLTIDNSGITASTSGDVDAGTVTISTSGSQLAINDSEVASRSSSSGVNAGQAGDLNLIGQGIAFAGSLFDVQTASGDTDSSLQGSNIVIDSSGGDALIEGGSSDGLTASTSGAVSAGTITIQNVDDLILDGVQLTSVAEATATDDAGIISITAGGNISLLNGLGIETSTEGTGEAGSITLLGASISGSNVSIESQALGANSDRAGSIVISGETVAFSNGSQISTETRSGFVTPSAGITISATNGDISLSSTVVEGTSTGNTDAGNVRLYGTSYTQSGGEVVTSSGDDLNKNGIIDSDEVGSGSAGSITIAGGEEGNGFANLESFSLSGGGDIRAVTNGEGEAGSVLIFTDGLFSMAGAEGNRAEISVAANALNSGQAGQLEFSAEAFDLRGAAISASTASEIEHDEASTISLTSHSGDISLVDSLIEGSTSGATAAGDIALASANDVSIIGTSEIRATTSSTGNAGSLSIRGDDIRVGDSAENDLNNRATVSSSATDEGDAGTVSLIASSLGEIQTSFADIASSSSLETENGGQAGTVSLRAGTLNIVETNIATSTASSKEGNVAAEVSLEALDGGLTMLETTVRGSTSGNNDAGDITMVASGAADLDNVLVESISSSSGNLAGAAGSILLDAQSISFVDSLFNVETASNDNSATAANITLDSNGGAISLTSSDDSGADSMHEGVLRVQPVLIGADSFNAKLVLESLGLLASTTGAASAGSITIQDAGNITLSGIDIETSANAAQGAAGSINITGSDLSANNVTIESSSSDLAGGQAGAISLNAGNLFLSESTVATNTASSQLGNEAATIDMVATSGGISISDSTIQGATSGDNLAGNILISAPGDINFANTTVNTATTGGGNAGAIDVATTGGDVQLIQGTTFSSNASGAGDAGSINLGSETNLINNIIITDSSIVTEAEASGGGDVAVLVSGDATLNDSVLSASASGDAADVSNGGNVSIQADLIIAENTQFTATATEGNGGNINVVADTFLRDGNSQLDASSDAGVDGEVGIEAVNSDENLQVEQSAPEYVNVAGMLNRKCQVQSLEDSSSFVVSGRPISTSPEAYQLASFDGLVIASGQDEISNFEYQIACYN